MRFLSEHPPPPSPPCGAPPNPTLVAGVSSGKLGQQQAHSVLFQFAHEVFDLPGDASFTLGGLMSAPLNKEEAGDICSVAPHPSGRFKHAALSTTNELGKFVAAGQVVRPLSGCKMPWSLLMQLVAAALHDALWSAELIRGYLKQCREEVARRLVDCCYRDGKLNKFWGAFANRKFLNKSL